MAQIPSKPRFPDDEMALTHILVVHLGRGAGFLAPPYKWEHEMRCFFRDPDGHLFEISQV